MNLQKLPLPKIDSIFPPRIALESRIEFETSPIKEKILVPYGRQYNAEWLEPLARNYPDYGSGGGSQVLVNDAEIVIRRVIDLSRNPPTVIFTRPKMHIKELKSALNRYMDVGHTEVTKEEIIRASAGDSALAKINLYDWQASGWIHVKMDLDDANSGDICVEIKGYIDNDKPWSDPMSGKM
ncbi:MAG: hypothetical protein ACSHX7_11855 [Luteolibacter sp.]